LVISYNIISKLICILTTDSFGNVHFKTVHLCSEKHAQRSYLLLRMKTAYLSLQRYRWECQRVSFFKCCIPFHSITGSS